MLRNIFIFLLLLLAGGAASAQTITLLQSKPSTGTGAVTSQAVTFTSNNTAGTLIIVKVNWGNNAAATYSVTDNKTGGSNTYTQFPNVVLATAGINDLTAFWTVSSASAQALTVTVSVSGAGSHSLRVGIEEYSSSTGWPASPIDVGNSAQNATANCCTSGNPGNITPTASPALISSAMQTGSAGVTGITVGGGCTEQPDGGTAGTGWLSDGRADGADNVNASATSQTCTYTWTTSAAWSALIASFKPNAAAGGGGVKQLSLTGVGTLLLRNLFWSVR